MDDNMEGERGDALESSPSLSSSDQYKVYDPASSKSILMLTHKGEH